MPKKPYAAEYVEFVRLFNRGEFFEAHETLEKLWRRTTGAEKNFYHGWIQAAAALHHLKNGNPKGCSYEAKRALEKLRRYPATYLGLNVRAFIEAFEYYLKESSDGSPFIELTS